MPTAKLLYPRSLNIGGVIYLKNVETPVSEEVALEFADDDRFFVEGLDGHSSEKKIAALQAKSNATKIREAADALDPDVDGHFTGDGRPSAAAISEALGQEITQHQVDVALGLGGKGRVTVKETKPPAADKPKIKKVKIAAQKKTEVPPAAKTETPPASGAAGATGADGHDPTTEGAI
ncbi:hypothetical protein [Hyphomicrobium sp. ghe19]|uniref:hypothetical protein n=1 Tax=Hyphomicrobium sp. ghe19 TaxID=2682968 RepID=UPI001367335A|nr:hypothetical protein HYPP_02507 [Hyphomicrobium sp. ghe19]